MKCSAVYIVNGEVHYCRRGRLRHHGKHRSRFVTSFFDYNGRVIATSRVRLAWAEWRMEASA